jgi:hypothetical protein
MSNNLTVSDFLSQLATLDHIQEEHAEWSRRNFGDNISKVTGGNLGSIPAVLGIIEEFGEWAAAKDLSDDEEDGCGDIIIFVCDFCTREGIKLSLLWPQAIAAAEHKFDHVMYASDATGKLAHVVLKRHQGVRGFADDAKYVLRRNEALVGILAYLIHYYEDSQEVIRNLDKTWAKVKQRNYGVQTYIANEDLKPGQMVYAGQVRLVNGNKVDVLPAETPTLCNTSFGLMQCPNRADLQAQLDNQRETIGNYQAQTSTLKEEVARYKRQCDALNDRNNDLERVLALRDNRIIELNAQVDVAAVKLFSALEENKEFSNQVVELQTTIRRLSADAAHTDLVKVTIVNDDTGERLGFAWTTRDIAAMLNPGETIKGPPPIQPVVSYHEFVDSVMDAVCRSMSIPGHVLNGPPSPCDSCPLATEVSCDVCDDNPDLCDCEDQTVTPSHLTRIVTDLNGQPIGTVDIPVSFCDDIEDGTDLDDEDSELLDDEDSTNPKDRIGQTKPPLDLIPPTSLVHLAMAMRHGAIVKGYGPFNWRDKKVVRSIYYAAAMRHITSALDGEDVDIESGVPHEAHAMACMAIILDALDFGNLIDDRPPQGQTTTAELIRRYTNHEYGGSFSQYGGSSKPGAVSGCLDSYGRTYAPLHFVSPKSLK